MSNEPAPMDSGQPPIPQMEPMYGEEEITAVTDYMRGGGWLTEHVRTRQFEERLAGVVGAKYCVATSNGTLSLLAALLASGIGRGDEVIVPDFTMIASANAVRLAGAVPVLIDVDERTLCADIDQMSAALTDRTKAIMSVSINGRSPGMAALSRWCLDRRLTLIEDAAQSFGSRSGGRCLGTFGRLGSYSFSPHKIITTGQGGAVVTDDESLAGRIRMVKDFGRRRPGSNVHDIVGYNFKFTDLQATVGLAQLAAIDERLARKRAIFARYRESLDGIVRFVETDLSETTPWFIDVLVERRDALQAHLAQDGIETRAFYPAVHSQADYAGNPADAAKPDALVPSAFPVSDRISQTGLWLPSSLKLADSDIDRVCSSIRRFYGGRR